MMNQDQATEQAIVQVGANVATRVTFSDIEANIASEHYFTAADGVAGAGPVIAAEFWHRTNGHAIVDYSEHTHVGHLTDEKGYERRPLVHRPTPTGALGLLTFCVLVLRNGTKIVGINYGAIDPAQHSAAQGRFEARAHAIDQIWPLMGYALREQLAHGTWIKGTVEQTD